MSIRRHVDRVRRDVFWLTAKTQFDEETAVAHANGSSVADTAPRRRQLHIIHSFIHSFAYCYAVEAAQQERKKTKITIKIKAKKKKQKIQ